MSGIVYAKLFAVARIVVSKDGGVGTKQESIASGATTIKFYSRK